MSLRAFFADAPRITVRDALSEFLGASDDGLIEYGYADAVRVAGHSCPTVAGAYLMALAGLRALYPDATPERGGIEVVMNGGEDEGTTGVIAQVFTLLTGAAAALVPVNVLFGIIAVLAALCGPAAALSREFRQA